MKYVSRTMIARLGILTASHGTVQGLRLLNNIVLARLLAPELFGIMVVVNTIRTGIELTSDIGVVQNIVSNPRADEPDFYDTAWTMQVIRGFVLASICALAAYPLSLAYGRRQFLGIFLIASLFFVYAGFESTGRGLAQKRLQLGRLTAFEIGLTANSTFAHILFALVSPNIWALVFGGISSSAGALILSYRIIPGLRHRFILARWAVRDIFSFGRWVFLATIVYFLSMNFDRLYMSTSISLAVLGTYGIARSLADMVSSLVTRFGNLLVFPIVAAAADSLPVLRQKLARARPPMLMAAALGVGGFIALSDIVVRLLYDARYQGAGTMLPVLALGVWFAILSTFNESVLLGIGKPVYSAAANAAKFVVLLIGLPLCIHSAGILGAVWVVAGSELVRYLPLWAGQKREGLSFARQDVALTLLMAGSAVAARTLLAAVGLTGTLASLFPALFR